MNIGAQLQQARRAHQLTQQDVATAIHVTRQTISNWETSRSLPDIDSLMHLSTVYHVSLDQLLRSEDIMNQLHAQEKAQRQARRLYRINLLLDGILIIAWMAQKFGHGSGLSGTTLLIVLLIVNLVTLKDARQRNWHVNQHRFSLTPHQSLLITAIAALLVGIWVLLTMHLSFYAVGYATGNGVIVALFIWGLLPTKIVTEHNTH
jgi:transcriptional regulator with XRE-family HTH domain